MAGALGPHSLRPILALIAFLQLPLPVIDNGVRSVVRARVGARARSRRRARLRAMVRDRVGNRVKNGLGIGSKGQ